MDPDLLYIFILFGSMTVIGLILLRFGDFTGKKHDDE